MAGQHTFLSSATPHPLVSEEAAWRVDLGQQDRLPESSHLSQFHVATLNIHGESSSSEWIHRGCYGNRDFKLVLALFSDGSTHPMWEQSSSLE